MELHIPLMEVLRECSPGWGLEPSSPASGLRGVIIPLWEGRKMRGPAPHCHGEVPPHGFSLDSATNFMGGPESVFSLSRLQSYSEDERQEEKPITIPPTAASPTPPTPSLCFSQSSLSSFALSSWPDDSFMRQTTNCSAPTPCQVGIKADESARFSSLNELPL